ncbi:MAG TPA: thioredoxin domain-containing protein [Nitrosopumilaceae archaeon]|nr:thioredoxin domain-containing protein [Nitrosopumilaceae archaeon]
MKRYYLLAIPAVIAIIFSYYYLVPTEPEEDTIITTQILMQNGSPLIGNPDAPITIVEWGDYQCTFCYKFHQSSKDLLIQEYVDAGKVNFVFRDFPLNGPDSILAAEASYCADDQGKYWEYHDELYKNWAGEKTGWVNRESLDRFANTVNLNLEQFNKCLDEKKYEQKVSDNYEFGASIGIGATPSFLVFNNEKVTKIVGNQPFSVFRQVIDTL